MSGIPPTPTDAGPGELPAWNVQRDGLEPGHCPCGSRLSGIGARCANCRQDLCADCSESTKNCENCGANICPTCAPTARYEDVACRIAWISREYTCEACAAEEDANLRRDYALIAARKAIE